MATPSLTSCFRRLGPSAAAAIVLSLTACSEGSVDPSSGSPANIAVRAVVASDVNLSAFGLWVDQVGVAVVRPPGDTIADTLVPRDPNEEELPLELTVMIQGSSEELLVQVTLYGSGLPLFEGEESMVVRASPAENVTPEIALSYVGPGANIQFLVVEPGDSVLTFGDSLRLRVTAYDAQENEVPQFFVSWQVSDNRVSVNAAGLVRAPSTRVSPTLTARTPTGVQGSGTLHVVPPPTEIRRLSDDGYEAPVGSSVPLRVRVVGADGIGIPLVSVTFVSEEGGGSVAPAVVLTDGGGVASATATFGPAVGPQVFGALVSGLSSATFAFQAIPLPAIGLDPSQVELEVAETSQLPVSSNVSVTNEGGGTLTGLTVSVEYPPGQPIGWLSGTLNRTVAPATLTLTASRGSLPPGTFSARAWVSSPVASNDPRAVDVLLTVTAVAPRMRVAPSSVSWQAAPGTPSLSPKTVSITNIGGGVLSGISVTITTGPDQPQWLNWSLSSTTAPATLTLTPQLGNVWSGLYTAEVRVSSPVADNSPRTVEATLDLFTAPTISNPGYFLMVMNDVELCAGQNPPGSSYYIYFDYSDPDGDLPVSFAAATFYGEPIRMDYQFKPNGNSGTEYLNGDVDGDWYSGYASFEPCIQFGPAENISVALTLSLYDLGGHQSNQVTINIIRPVGANAPPPGAPGAVAMPNR